VLGVSLLELLVRFFSATRILNEREPLVLSLDLDASSLTWCSTFQRFVWSDEVVVDLHTCKYRRIRFL
jgi:hypothetical protein